MKIEVVEAMPSKHQSNGDFNNNPKKKLSLKEFPNLATSKSTHVVWVPPQEKRL
jgi:hypothetical protein